ncbi:uncharacterized protein TrAtP1_001317 [Trichoderma atroviride]|uniref:uncharacterized protein n=1 Tax=Hypocrea atroviridis TaxID=63577 RepID=UPI00332335D6|nr:hypothetical protein TrAtP1_001317 [Trichoderma atroviride]
MLRETLVREALTKQAQDKKPLPDIHTHAELLRGEIAAIKQNLESVQKQNGGLKRQNDEVIQLLKDEKRLKPTCVFEDQLQGACI